MLERAVVRGDRLSHHLVVLVEQRHQLLGIGLLRERGEAAQVTERDRDLASMAGQQLLAIA